MPIPAFDANNVLPPHAGDPRRREQLSPFPCTTTEFCQRFMATPERLAILDGFLRFRQLLVQAGFVAGLHWVDGSFLEDIEAEANRPPNDLDVVTFYLPPDAAFNARVAAGYPVLRDQSQIKTTYRLDHYFLDMAAHPVLTVEWTQYWTGLFSHRRDGVWKGMLRIDLNTPVEDTNARALLQGMP
jgi:hypothetical protein